MRCPKTSVVWLLAVAFLAACGGPAPVAAPAAEPAPEPQPEGEHSVEISLPPDGEAADAATQIAGAVHAAPPDLRDEAVVLGYAEDGSLVTLRRGSNQLVCLADQPGDERFHVACYQASLEPFMARGRELRSQGVTGPDSVNTRHEEIEAGTLPMPSAPTVVYTLGGGLEIFDPETGAVEGGRMVYAVYTPYETEASTGLSTTPAAPGAPWIMRPGTPTAHIMVTPPAPAPAKADSSG